MLKSLKKNISNRCRSHRIDSSELKSPDAFCPRSRRGNDRPARFRLGSEGKLHDLNAPATVATVATVRPASLTLWVVRVATVATVAASLETRSRVKALIRSASSV